MTEQKIAEAEALRMWPETLHLGKYDGLIPQSEVDRRLLIQREAYVMGEQAAFIRALGCEA